jgi:hypothetical protein
VTRGTRYQEWKFWHDVRQDLRRVLATCCTVSPEWSALWPAFTERIGACGMSRWTIHHPDGVCVGAAVCRGGRSTIRTACAWEHRYVAVDDPPSGRRVRGSTMHGSPFGPKRDSSINANGLSRWYFLIHP